MNLRALGEPSRVWPYLDADGGLLGYVARYDVPEGKQFRCWTWGARGSAAPSWGCGHWNKPRPLYGLQKLSARANDRVLVVQGEKAADAAQAVLENNVVITWPGTAQSWHRADWEPVRGRRVTLWPDNDATSIECMRKLAAILADPRGLACAVRIIDTAGMEEGFDAADWTGTRDDLVAWAKPRLRAYEVDDQDSPVPSDPPPFEEDDSATAAWPPNTKARRPTLAVVEGNTVRQLEPDAEALPAAMSEDMLADHFARVHASSLRYVRPWGAWFQWRGDGWYRDETGQVDRLAVEVTRQALYWSEAATMSAGDKRKINSRRTAGAVRDLAMSDRRMAAAVDQWDTDPWLLGVPGGVVDLKLGTLKEARPNDYITKRAAVAPKTGPAPIWTRFLETVTAGNAELIAFLQRFAGYALTGETTEQCLAFLYGTGQNGKGVFITTLASILGDYAVTADADVFMETDLQRHTTEMARLRGARLVTVDETDSSKRWNEKRIKRITGGGKIEARFMRQDDFEYVPAFKLLIAGNHKPQLRGVGKAIQRRIHLVPFTVTIPDSQRDDELPQKLKAEYPAILQWMIEGCLAWREQRLSAPPEVREATSRYIDGEDVIGEWLEERCEQYGETARPLAYKNYRAWVEGRGERAWSSKAFKGALEERGYGERKSNGTWFVVGLSLRPLAGDESPRYPYQ
jgi:putative DNA primase/helicase